MSSFVLMWLKLSLKSLSFLPLARDSSSCSSLSNFRQFLIPIEGILKPIPEKLYGYIDLSVIVE